MHFVVSNAKLGCAVVEPGPQHEGTGGGALGGLLVPDQYILLLFIEATAGGRNILPGSGEAPSPARQWFQLFAFLLYAC